jgi:hypothetical protein
MHKNLCSMNMFSREIKVLFRKYFVVGWWSFMPIVETHVKIHLVKIPGLASWNIACWNSGDFLLLTVLDSVLFFVTLVRKLSPMSTARRSSALLTIPILRIPICGGGWTISFVPSSLVISLQQTPVEPFSNEQSFVLASAGEICEAHWIKGLQTSSLGQDFCTARFAGWFTGWFVGWFVGSIKKFHFGLVFAR